MQGKYYTYDGTIKTLPPSIFGHGVIHRYILRREGLDHDGATHLAFFNPTRSTWHTGPGAEYPAKAGDQFTPIPTPADCEKWEEMKQTAQAVYDEHTITDDCKTAQVREPLMYVLGSARAAKAPKEQG